MTRLLPGALMLAGMLAGAACSAAPPAANAPADIAAVNAVRTAFQTAFNAGNAAGVATGYTADAISMNNHQPTAIGRDAITAANKTEFAAMRAKLELTADETRTIGNWGFDRGHFKITLTPKGGGSPITDEGRYVVLLQKGTDGAWKVSRDISNSSLALPAAAATPPKAAPAKAAQAKAKTKARPKGK